MEGAMTTSKTLRRSVATGAILTALSFSAAQAGDTAFFRDVLKPNGHERTAAARLADGRACGAAPDRTIRFMPTFQTCMSGKGWVLDHYAPDRSTPVHGTVVNFVDVKGNGAGGARGNPALHADQQACEAPRRDLASAAFKQCMAGRGWKYILTQYAPPPRPQPQSRPWLEWGTTPITSATDNMPRNDGPSVGDIVSAASQATADSLTAMQQQMQNDLIRANEPVQQN
jgi:hypothetical protein